MGLGITSVAVNIRCVGWWCSSGGGGGVVVVARWGICITNVAANIRCFGRLCTSGGGSLRCRYVCIEGKIIAQSCMLI